MSAKSVVKPKFTTLRIVEIPTRTLDYIHMYGRKCKFGVTYFKINGVVLDIEYEL